MFRIAARAERPPQLRVLLLAALLAALASPAASAAAVPMDVVPVNPVNGGVFATGNAVTASVGARWTPASAHPRELYLEITNQNILGQDGTLANDFQYMAGGAALYKSDADPSSWTGQTAALFLLRPGTYYFQFHAIGTSQECGTADAGCTLASRVFSFRTAAPQASPPPVAAPSVTKWKVADATSEVRRVIRHATKRSPSNLHRACSRVSSLRMRCSADWYDKRWVWAGTIKLSIDSAFTDITYAFKGIRASRACLRTRSISRCGRRTAF